MLSKLATLGIEKRELLHSAESLFHYEGRRTRKIWPRAGSFDDTSERVSARP